MDEEVNIERCLRSLAWIGEAVVVDSGSTDRTVALAQRAGARVVEHRQTGPFRISDQRNWALEHGKLHGDWVIFLDADEECTPTLASEILQRCATVDGPDAYQLAPRYLFRGRWMRRSMRYPAWHDRLLRRGSVIFDGGVWEHFRPGPTVGRIAEPYLHHGNSKGFDDWLVRHGRYSSWEAESVRAYLANGDPLSFRTSRRARSRKLAARLWLVRPIARFVLMYILRGGFLDGPEAFPFCLRYAIYEYMTVEKIIEGHRRSTGRPL